LKIYVAFDDTDALNCGRGTGKLARWFEDKLPENTSLFGVLRQQLLFRDDIPYTSHNSSLVCVVEAQSEKVIPELIDLATEHINEHFVEGSDPGLCVCSENNPALKNLIPFGLSCLETKMTQDQAHFAATGAHLSGHGGTNDGVIGSAAGVGLTHNGMHGRFNELRKGDFRLRDVPEETTVAFLKSVGIEVISMERKGTNPINSDIVKNFGWLRPMLFKGAPFLPVVLEEPGVWGTLVRKKGILK